MAQPVPRPEAPRAPRSPQRQAPPSRRLHARLPARRWAQAPVSALARPFQAREPARRRGTVGFLHIAAGLALLGGPTPMRNQSEGTQAVTAIWWLTRIITLRSLMVTKMSTLDSHGMHWQPAKDV